jgi:hypothetical protein
LHVLLDQKHQAIHVIPNALTVAGELECEALADAQAHANEQAQAIEPTFQLGSKSRYGRVAARDAGIGQLSHLNPDGAPVAKAKLEIRALAGLGLFDPAFQFQTANEFLDGP